MKSQTIDVDVFVVGAGPTGLAAANEAVRHGLSVHIVDSKAHRSTWSKALVAHARTLEVFEAMGTIDAVLEAGVPFSALRVTPGDGQAAIRVNLMELDWGDTRYPYWLSIPQFETERCLEEHLSAQGVEVAWHTTFNALVDHGDSVTALVTTADGVEETWRAKWLIGCDGGRSPVREQVGIDFERESIGQTFVIADALGEAPMPEDEGSTSLAGGGVLFLVPMPEEKRWRIIAHLPDHPEGDPVEVDSELVDRLIRERLGFEFGAHDLSWTSQFVLKQGIAETYRSGRVFIAGDAAHLHSPVGGQGLNTGVQDAHALMWRLALVERGAPEGDALLDSYTVERRTIAASMVKNTTRATNIVTLRGGLLARLRAHVARMALKRDVVQNKLGRSVGMLDLAYEESPVVVSGGRGVRGQGGRLPNPLDGDMRLHDHLDDRRHSVVLVGAGSDRLAVDLRAAGVHCVRVERAPARGVFADREGVLDAELGNVRLLVVRPDRVVAVAVDGLDPSAVYSYARDVLGIAPGDL